MQEVVPRLQAADLLWQCQGAQAQEARLEQAKRLSHLHHILHPGPSGEPN